MLQVVAELLGGDEGLLVVDPEHDLVALPEELDEDKRLLQPHPLLCQLAEQELPQTVEFIQPLLDLDLLEVILVDHLHAGVVQDYDGVAVSSNLRLKCLMFLDLGLEVGWILVALIAGSLEFLIDPALQLVSISSEVLISPAVLQLLSPQTGGGFELQILVEDLRRGFC